MRLFISSYLPFLDAGCISADERRALGIGPGRQRHLAPWARGQAPGVESRGASVASQVANSRCQMPNEAASVP